MVRAPTMAADDAEVLHPLLRWFEREGEAGFDAVTDAVLEQLPSLAEDEGAGPLRDAIASHLPMIAAVVARAEGTGGVALAPPAEQYVVRLARRGTPLPVLMRSYEVGHAELWRRMVASLRDGPYRLPAVRRAEVLERASTRLFDYMHVVTTLAVTAYTRESSRVARREASRRAGVVAALLAGTVDEPEAEQVLGYRLAGTHVGYVAAVPDSAGLEQLDRVVATLRERVGAWQHLSVPSGDRAVHGWFAARRDGWRDALRGLELPPGGMVACGAPHPGIEGLRATHREALEAARVEGRLGAPRSGADARPSAGDGRRGAVLYEDVAVAALASRDPDLARAFVERELGRLADDGEPGRRLRATLAVFLEELASPTRTGRRMDVHPNTVVKRLGRIEELLGRPVEPGSLALRVALELEPLVRAARDADRVA